MDNVYRVKWREARPIIEHGRVTTTGTKRITEWATFRNPPFMEKTRWYHFSIKEAILHEMRSLAEKCGTWRKLSPFDLLIYASRLRRLYVTLEKHGLIK